MKKTLAMLMTATMVLSMGVGASAAENGYSISLQNNKLTLSSSENTVTYQLEEDEILLGQSAASRFLSLTRRTAARRSAWASRSR